MSTLLIEGGRRLSGAVDVEGNKNAALPLLAACLLTTEECVLHNMPRISDVEVMSRLLVDLGAQVEGVGGTTLRVKCTELTKDEPDGALVGRLRGSVLLLGPLLARQGRAWLAPPGGDFPTRRSIATHLEALIAMGARPMEGPGHRLEAPDGLKPASLYLFEASVTGTETALLAAAAAHGTSEIRHAACEPHVVELCNFLAKMGAGITGQGTSTIRVEGGARLHGATHRLWGDYIDAGSWAVVAAITGGEIEVRGARFTDMEVIAAVLKRMNIHCVTEENLFRIETSKIHGAGRITTSLWPGFPSDLVSLVTVLATQAQGSTARARLALRAPALCARTNERDERGSLPLRSAPHHRHRPAPFAWAAARQPGSTVGDGAHCCRPRGRRTEPARTARDGRTRLRATGRPAQGAWRAC